MYKDVSVANSHIGGRDCVQHVTKFLMFYFEPMFTHKCIDHETCSCACSHTTRRVSAHFWLTKSCLCITFNIWHHVCHQISNRRSRNDVQPHDLTYEPFSVSNFPHTKSCLRTLVWPTQRTVMCVHCEKTSLCATFLTYIRGAQLLWASVPHGR